MWEGKLWRGLLQVLEHVWTTEGGLKEMSEQGVVKLSATGLEREVASAAGEVSKGPCNKTRKTQMPHEFVSI